MKQRPVMMQPPLAQATHEGWKDITRRARGLEKMNVIPWKWQYFFENGEHIFINTINAEKLRVKCPYGIVGDQLYIRECWQGDDLTGFIYRGEHPTADIKAGDLDDGDVSFRGWKSAMLMPKIAARTFVEIISIRAEQIQDITNGDAVREGIQRETPSHSARVVYRDYARKHKPSEPMPIITPGTLMTALQSFKTLWYSINGKQSWDDNIWVWRIEYKKVIE